jgi:hypothetical protein
MSTPTANIFKNETKKIKDDYDEVDKVGGEFDFTQIKISFAGFYFVTKTFHHMVY